MEMIAQMQADALKRELMDCLVLLTRLRRLVAECSPTPETADAGAKPHA